jgi:methionyl aminopeptidase
MSYIDAALAPQRKTGQIKLHGPAAFEGMRRAGRLAAECLDMLTDEIRPGVSTQTIDRLVFDFAMAHDSTPATLMYRGYRKSTCTSINHVVCHGIPSEKPLKEGDIVNVDVTLILDGWHGDSSRMYAVGAIPRRAERLIEVTYEAMMRGIAVIKPGATTGDIGAAIQAYVEGQHMSVVRDFCGHGVGRLFHDQSRAPAREGALRRLDGGDARPLAVSAVRAHRGGSRRGRGNLHAVAARARAAALRGLNRGASSREAWLGDAQPRLTSFPFCSQ